MQRGDAGRGRPEDRPPYTHNLFDLFGFLDQTFRHSLEGWEQFLGNLDTHGDMYRGRKSIVCTLPHVNVVVRMNRLLRLKSIQSHDFYGAVGDDFVDVHVTGRP